MFLISSILLLGGYGAGMGGNPAAAKYGRNKSRFFFTAKKIFISGKSRVITSCCYCLAQGYGGLGTNGNAAGRYGE